MKKINKAIAFILSVCLAFSSLLTAYADDLTCGDYTYTVNDDGVTATITAYTGDETVIVVPEKMDDYTVTVLGDKVFYNNKTVTSITLPLTVETLVSNNFSACSALVEVKGTDNIKVIGNHCFNYSKKLSSLSKMNRLVSVSSYSFNDCDSLTEFYFPATTESISGYSFADNGTMLSMADDNPYFTCIDGVIYDKDVTTVLKCSSPITEYTFPETVTTVENRAFWYCKLEKIHGGENVKTVNSYAFSFCENLESIESLCNLETVKANAFQFAVTGAVDLPQTITNLSTNAFSGCYMTELTIHNNITSIPFECFCDCSYLTHIVIEEGVDSIGASAFQGCNRLRKVELPESLTTVGLCAFTSSLMEIYIPSGVNSIGKYAFGFGYNRLNWTYPAKAGYKIFGHSGTAAQTYAESNNIAFYDIDTLFSIDVLGSTIRVSNPGGMRFGFRINETSLPLDGFEDAELGFLYCYSDDASMLSLENAGTNGVKKKTAVNTESCSGYKNYNLVFTNMPQSAYDSDVSVRAYAVVNGFVYYSQPITRNARDIARAVCADTSNNEELISKIKEIYKV